jgi:hypothetical protein
MRESSAYEMILDEGRLEGRRQGVANTLAKLGRKHFGPPSAESLESLNRIADIELLDHLVDTIDQAKSWEDWLQS